MIIKKLFTYEGAKEIIRNSKKFFSPSETEKLKIAGDNTRPDCLGVIYGK